MNQSAFSQIMYPTNLTVFYAIFIPVMVWSIIWKGIALWKAVRNGAKVWFIVLLVVNTVGILEILYIFVISKKKAAVPIQ